MLQIKNDTPFKAHFFVVPNALGIDTVYTVLKATFDLAPRLRIAEKQVPVVLEDQYWGDAGTSSLKYATEAHLEKPGTDVVVIGQACAPGDKPVPELDVGLQIAGRFHGAHVSGDREWQKGRLGLKRSDPVPFSRMPLVYERAYGGTHVVDEAAGKILSEARNPIGKGFRGKRGSDELPSAGIPNIENPADPSAPVGFGFVAPAWQPRLAFAGTYDEKWQKKRAPYLPEDFDHRFFNAAPPPLVFAEPLRGGEDVLMRNMSPRGEQRFKLPVCAFRLEITIAGKKETPPLTLETVLIEPTDERLCLSWRASAPCDKKALKVELITIALASDPVL